MGQSGLYAWGTWGTAPVPSPLQTELFCTRETHSWTLIGVLCPRESLVDSDWSVKTVMAESDSTRIILINYIIVPFPYVLIPFCTNVNTQSYNML